MSLKQEKELVRYLADKNTWVSSNELTSYLDVSLRTLRTLVKNINSNYEDDVIKSSNRGYMLVASRKIFDSIVEKMTDKGINRQQEILKRLLNNPCGLDIYDLADEMFVSESTILSDINTLKKSIAAYELTIIKNKDLVYLGGNEHNIRRLISDSVYRETQNSIVSVRSLDKFFEDIDIEALKDYAVKEINRSSFVVDNDYKFLEFVLHLCILISRRNSDYESYEYHFDGDEFKRCTYNILEYIKKEYHIVYDRLDFDHINALLMITVSFKDSSRHMVDRSITSFVRQIVKNVYNEFLVNLNHDEFINIFALHLDGLINGGSRAARNPLLYEIKNVYPIIYEISVYISGLIRAKYPSISMNDDEISYIALHVGTQVENQTVNKIRTIIVNPNYLNLNNIIRNKMESNFGNDIIVLGIYSNIEDAYAGLEDIDLVVSTYDIKENLDCDYVRISIFLNDQDLIKVMGVIRQIKNKSRNYEDNLIRYFDGSFVYFGEDSYSPSAIIKILCSKHKDLDDSFYKRVILREEMSPTEYLNMAIVHPLESNEEATFITVGTFKKPIRWHLNDINIVLLLSVSKKDRNEFTKIFAKLVEIFSSNEWKKVAHTIDTYEKFLGFMHSQEVRR